MEKQKSIQHSKEHLKSHNHKLAKQSYVPFLYKVKRQFIKQMHDVPPIGTYQCESQFSQKNKFTVLEEQNILIKDSAKKLQMSVFKSSKKRFNEKINQSPGPTSYINCVHNQQRIKRQKNKSELIKSNVKIVCNKTCPSIPGKGVKFGYTKDVQGNIKILEKTTIQLQKEKNKALQYCKNLTEQKFYNPSKLMQYNSKLSHTHNNLSQINCKVEKLIKTQYSQKQISKQNNIIKRPRINHTLLTNKQSQKPKIKLLGPGHYLVNLDTIKKEFKRQKYQFFGSSSIRFQHPQQFQSQQQTFSNKDYSLSRIKRQYKKMVKKPTKMQSKSASMRSSVKFHNQRINDIDMLLGFNQSLNINKDYKLNKTITAEHVIKSQKKNLQKRRFNARLLSNIEATQQNQNNPQKQTQKKIRICKKINNSVIKQGKINYIHRSQCPINPKQIKGIVSTPLNDNYQTPFSQYKKKNKIYNFKKFYFNKQLRQTNQGQVCSWENEDCNKINMNYFNKKTESDLNSSFITPKNQEIFKDRTLLISKIR